MISVEDDNEIKNLQKFCKRFLNYIYENSTIYLDRKYKRYEFFRNSHSVKELSEFLASENGEG